MLRLEAERRTHGLTLTQLGKLVGIHASDLSKFETRRARPYPGQIARLVAALGVESGEALLTEVDAPCPTRR
jgi:transcriptional regulator with XRE-family HTH domain